MRHGPAQTLSLSPLPPPACCALWSPFFCSHPGLAMVLEAELKAVGRAAAKVCLVGVAGRLHGKDESGLIPNYTPIDFWKAGISDSRGAEAIY